MNNLLLLLGAAGFLAWGCIVSALLTPLVRQLAFRFDIVDCPDGHRKLHQHPIPLGGGVSVFVGFWSAVIAGHGLLDYWGTFLRDDHRNLLALFAASLTITAVGLLDDGFGLRGRHKLLGQIVAASLLVVAAKTMKYG